MTEKNTFDAVAKLDRAVDDFFGGDIDKDFRLPLRILAGVSGGPDSLAMLYSLHAHATQIKGVTIAVAHLNHGLRGAEADADAEFVREQAEQLGLAFFGAKADVAAYAHTAHLSVEDAARRARHTLFHHAIAAWDAAGEVIVALAHTRDDNAETMIMHLLRGAGLEGLRGMRSEIPLPAYDPSVVPATSLTFTFATPQVSNREEYRIIRPLFECSRAEVEAYCAARNLSPRHDSSNDDLHYARNRVRHDIMPALARFYGENNNDNHQRLLNTFTRLSNLLGLDMQLIDSVVRDNFRWEEEITDGYIYSIYTNVDNFPMYPWALGSRSIRLAYSKIAGSTTDLTSQHVESVLALARSKGGTKEIHLPHGVIARHSYKKLELYREIEQESLWQPVFSVADMSLANTLEVRNLRVMLTKDKPQRPKQAAIDVDALEARGGSDFTLSIRPVIPGDKFWPLGATGHKKVQDILVDMKVPASERSLIPVVVARWPLTGQEMIVWLGTTGYIDDRLKLTDATRRALMLTLTTDKVEEEDGDG